MVETGIAMYDLAGNWCEECGRAKSFRIWPGMLTGCKTCDEAITRHRCTLPAVTDRAPGQGWQCPDCDSDWRLAEKPEPCPDCCGACEHVLTVRRWVLEERGERYDSAPRYKPVPWTPLRNPFRSVFTGASLPRPSLPEECHRTPGGIQVHVKPGCRCKR